MSNNFEIHESIYQKEIATGATAWGGISEDERLKGWDSSLQTLLKNESFPKSGQLLELGSGLGTVSRFFAKKGYQTFGIEISPSAVNKSNIIAEELNLPFRAFQGTAACLSQFEVEKFDIVFDANCLHCIFGSDRKRVFKEVFCVLKPNGFFFVSTNIGIPKDEKYLKDFDLSSKCLFREGIPYRYFGSYDSIIKEIKGSGFNVIHTTIKINTWWDHLVVYALKPENC